MIYPLMIKILIFTWNLSFYNIGIIDTWTSQIILKSLNMLAKLALNSKHAAKGYQRIIREILRISCYTLVYDSQISHSKIAKFLFVYIRNMNSDDAMSGGLALRLEWVRVLIIDCCCKLHTITTFSFTPFLPLSFNSVLYLQK